MKKALITGITGQDGSYLAEFLLEKGYEVHGVTRRASISNTLRIDHLILENAIRLHDGDLSDSWLNKMPLQANITYASRYSFVIQKPYCLATA